MRTTITSHDLLFYVPEPETIEKELGVILTDAEYDDFVVEWKDLMMGVMFYYEHVNESSHLNSPVDVVQIALERIGKESK